jgi:hypothetical protein
MSHYLDGKLRTSEKIFVSRHINICPACRHELDELLTAVKLLRGLPEASAPPAFWTQLSKRLMLAGQPKQRRSGIAGFFPGGRLWPGAAVAAALILIIGFTSLWYGLAGQQWRESKTFRVARSTPDEYGEISSIENGKEKAKATGAAPAVGKEKAITSGRQQQATSPPSGEEHEARQRQFADGQQDSAPASPTTLILQENAGAKQPAKIVHRTRLDLEVDDRDRAYNLLFSLVQKRGGKMEVDTDKDTSRLVIRVPILQMLDVLKEIELIGKVSHREAQDLDVTADYLNIQEHLEQLQQEKEKLLSLVKSSPGSLGEEDPVQAELKSVQVEIEKTEKSLKNIEEDLSTANIYVFLH